MKYKFKKGICIVEIIMTIALLGILITPLISMLILSQNIYNHSELEYKSMLLAQNYMEEIQELSAMDINEYEYKGESNSFEKLINEENNIVTKIIIRPENDKIYNIEIGVFQNNKELSKLLGNKIFYHGE